MQTSSMTLRLKGPQARVFSNPKRFKILVAGRRFGKTTLALWCMIITACTKPGSLCYYVAPTYAQAKRIAWRTLKQLIPPAGWLHKSESELSIELLNGSRIQLHGADRPDSLRGVGLDFAVLDEYADMRSETWPTVVRPMLSDKNGGALCIGTPRGLNHFYDLYVDAGPKPNWARFQYSTEEGGYVSPEEQAAARAEIDPKRYRQEYQASFETLQGRVYYEFDRGRNVTKLDLLPNAPLMIGMDFNVNPMTAVVAQRSGDQCQIIHEMVLTNSNTQEMMDEINRKYQGRQGAVHPDPSGSARKTSAPVGQTDFTLIEQAGWPVYHRRTYPVVDRVNSVNAMLCNAQGQRRLLISPSCTHLIKALDGLTYKQDTKLPDKSSGLHHIADALGYLIMGGFPMVPNNPWSVSKGL